MITVAVLFLMGLWGCLAIYNANAYSQNPFHYAGKQLLWLIIGIFVLWGSSKIDYKKYIQFLWLIAGVAYLSLLGVFIAGHRINGMKGWYDLGVCLIQPSEIAKPLYMLTLCAFVRKDMSSLKLFFTLCFISVLWCIPLALQPDFGTMLIYIIGFLIVYILAGGKVFYLIPASLAGVPFVYYIYRTKPYVVSRLTAFINPSADAAGSGWHILQLQYTLARGGLSGQSWGNGLWSNSYLPLSHSDSSFASLVEAIGFIGAMPVIIGFCLLAFAGYRFSRNIKDSGRKIFVMAMPFLIASQALLHMSVNVGLLPPTGITLPMFSYGGSSLISIMLSFGMILSATDEDSTQDASSPRTAENQT